MCQEAPIQVGHRLLLDGFISATFASTNAPNERSSQYTHRPQGRFFKQMATAGGTPPNGAAPKPKREITPEQKRTYAGLAVVGVLALIVAGIYVPPMLQAPSSVPTAPPTASGDAATGNTATLRNAAVTTPTGVPGRDPSIGGSLGGTTVSVPTTTTAQSAPTFLTRSRIDPFQPALLNPPPAPTPLPPDPVTTVTAPNGFGTGVVTVSPIADPRLREAVAQPLNIGSPNVPRIDTATAPRDAFPFARNAGGDNAGGAPQLSYDKRLAGVIIGDGVRALLELPSGDQRVVQPGDEVEGIRVLNIERFRQGDRTVSRMLIRDTDGSQKYVELKASPNPPGGGGEGTAGGEGLR